MDIPAVNRRLVDIYGSDLLGQPIYRCVWSLDEIEKRFSTFEDYIEGTNILIRRVKEVREVRKYNYIEPQWVLEKLFHNQHNKEILDNKTLSPLNCTYEPVWCFGHEDNGRARRPIWRAIEFILLSINNPSKLTPSQMTDAEIDDARKDEEIMAKLLEEKMPDNYLHSSIKDGETVMLNDNGPKR